MTDHPNREIEVRVVLPGDDLDAQLDLSERAFGPVDAAGRDQWREAVAAIIAERNRMARDIHDTLAQGFTGVIMHLEAAEEAISRSRPEFVASHVRGAGEIARDGLREARRSVQARITSSAVTWAPGRSSATEATGPLTALHTMP